jgi:cytochrome P450
MSKDDGGSMEFPMRRTCPFAPPPGYAELRERDPISRITLPGGKVAWLLTRDADVRAALASPHISSDPRRPGFPEPRAEGEMETRPPLLIEMDPPEHSIYRRMLAGEFTVRRINDLRPLIQQAADERIDALLREGPPADLVAGFALPVPSMMICHLLGVPYADHEFFESRTRAATMKTRGDDEGAAAVIAEVAAYLDGLVADKDREPTDDLIGRLIQEYGRTGALSHDRLVNMAVLLLLAGHETTASTIALGVVMFLEHPDQLAALRDDPALAAGAVEELVRLQSLGDAGAARAVVADIEIGGRLLRAGEGILPLIPAANRDPEVIDRPDEFDIRRGNRRHLGFGFGIHRCLGENLARATVEIALRTLFDRIPTLRLAAPVDELPFKYDSQIFGLHELPVRW